MSQNHNKIKVLQAKHGHSTLAMGLVSVTVVHYRCFEDKITHLSESYAPGLFPYQKYLLVRFSVLIFMGHGFKVYNHCLTLLLYFVIPQIHDFVSDPLLMSISGKSLPSHDLVHYTWREKILLYQVLCAASGLLAAFQIQFATLMMPLTGFLNALHKLKLHPRCEYNKSYSPLAEFLSCTTMNIVCMPSHM